MGKFPIAAIVLIIWLQKACADVPALGDIPFLNAFEPLIQVAQLMGSGTQTWVDETGTAHMGIRKLDKENYSLYTLGCRIGKNAPLVSVGYGFGRQIKFKRVYATMDALTQLRSPTDFNFDAMLLVVRMRLGAGIEITDRLSLFGGMSLRNIRFSDSPLHSPSTFIRGAHERKIWRDNWPGFFVGVQY